MGTDQVNTAQTLGKIVSILSQVSFSCCLSEEHQQTPFLHMYQNRWGFLQLDFLQTSMSKISSGFFAALCSSVTIVPWKRICSLGIIGWSYWNTCKNFSKSWEPKTINAMYGSVRGLIKCSTIVSYLGEDLKPFYQGRNLRKYSNRFGYCSRTLTPANFMSSHLVGPCFCMKWAIMSVTFSILLKSSRKSSCHEKSYQMRSPTLSIHSYIQCGQDVMNKCQVEESQHSGFPACAPSVSAQRQGLHWDIHSQM